MVSKREINLFVYFIHEPVSHPLQIFFHIRNMSVVGVALSVVISLIVIGIIVLFIAKTISSSSLDVHVTIYF